jgi:DNA-directed RNA polymerase specialized sigma subunit
MSDTRQQQDLALWEQWKSTGDSQTLKDLVDKLNPLIHKELGKWGSTVPKEALESKARLLTVDALKTYNPNRGAAVGTHVASRLRKLSRFVYPYQNVARLPENKQLLYNTFNVAFNQLYDEKGREPTSDELADNLSWSPKKVTELQRVFGRQELVESEGAFAEEDSHSDSLVDFYYHGLSPQDKLLFQDITGYGGKQLLANTELTRKHKITQGQLSYKKRRFVDQLQDIQKGKI